MRWPIRHKGSPKAAVQALFNTFDMFNVFLEICEHGGAGASTHLPLLAVGRARAP